MKNCPHILHRIPTVITVLVIAALIGGVWLSATTVQASAVQLTAPAYQSPDADSDRRLYDDPELFVQLSSAKQNLLELKFGKKPSITAPATGLELGFKPASPNATIANILVNNPISDTTTQDTQSETALVLGSGSNVVAFFNDSGSYQQGVGKFTGYGYSADGGASFVDGGTLPATADGDAGDPVLVRQAASNTLILATLAFTSSEKLMIFRSTDNGVTWSAPVNGAPGFNTTTGSHDKQWLAADNFPGPGYGNVYMFWRNFGTPGGMQLTRSTDGGLTWGPSGAVTLLSGSGQGAMLSVGTDHAVYAFWYDSSAAPRSIKLRKSTDLGLTFGPASTVATLLGTGVNGDLGMGFRTNSFPQTAVNPVNGNLYLVYNDNPAGADRGDVYFQQSTDGGVTWSAPVRVNNDATTNDQVFPAIAVTPDGTKLAITWYDRRLDPANLLIDRFGVIASLSGNTVTFGNNFRITDQSFPAVYGVDPVVNSTYMGDYDMMAADNNYFYTTWGDNRDNSLAAARKQANVRFAKIPVTGPGANLVVANTSYSDVAGGNNNGIAEPGETLELNIGLSNQGTVTATNVSGVMAVLSGPATMVNAVSPYTDVTVGATVTNTTPFKILIDPAYLCGQPLTVVFTGTYNLTDGVVYSFSVPVGGIALGVPQVYTSTDVPKSIPDNNATGITSTLPVTSNTFVGDVNLTFNLTHTYDSDLEISLISPAGTNVLLVNQRGSSGDNFTNTTLDDEASTPISSGTAPFSGSYRPDNPLSTFDGQLITGTWQLKVADRAGLDTGNLLAWNLQIAPGSYVCAIYTPTLVQLSNSAYAVNESAGTALVTATLSAISAQTLTVQYGTTNNTALAGSDYTAASGVLTFTPGITVATFSVPIIDNGLVQPSRAFTVTLSNPNGLLLGAPVAAAVTIIDNDTYPTVQFSAPNYNTVEGSGTATISVTLSAPYPVTATVVYATSNGTALAGSDYVTATGTLTFIPGTTTALFAVPILNDGLFEPIETVNLSLSSPTNASLGAPNPAVLTISDNDYGIYLPLIRRD
jgi:subtilisin-like proprotein convertase family protein